MPIVIVSGDADWAVPNHKPTATEPFTDRQSLTLMIGQILPDLIANAVSEFASDVIVSPDEVFVDFQPMNPNGVNQPNLWIRISPMRRDSLIQNMAEIFDDIVGSLMARLTQRLGFGDIPTPSIDWDLAFLEGCGCSTSDRLEVTSRW